MRRFDVKQNNDEWPQIEGILHDIHDYRIMLVQDLYECTICIYEMSGQYTSANRRINTCLMENSNRSNTM